MLKTCKRQNEQIFVCAPLDLKHLRCLVVKKIKFKVFSYLFESIRLKTSIY
jgi:hypothetical protein